MQKRGSSHAPGLEDQGRGCGSLRAPGLLLFGPLAAPTELSCEAEVGVQTPPLSCGILNNLLHLPDPHILLMWGFSDIVGVWWTLASLRRREELSEEREEQKEKKNRSGSELVATEHTAEYRVGSQCPCHLRQTLRTADAEPHSPP